MNQNLKQQLCRHALSLVACLGAFGSASAQSAQSAQGWRIDYPAQPGTSGRTICAGAGCRQSQPAQSAKLLKTCLYRDKSSAGLFSRGEWRAAVAPADEALCQEVLYADLDGKVLSLRAPLMQSTGQFLQGELYIHCTSSGGTVGTGATGEGDPCSSEFFAPYPANPRYRVLRRAAVSEAVQQSNLVAALEQHKAHQLKEQEQQALAQYRREFEAAKRSLAAIKAFEDRYAGNDPENLIPQLSGVKRELWLAEYRTRFDTMQGVAAIEAFIADYQGDDPDGKIGLAKVRLEEAQRTAQAHAQAQEAEKAAQQKAKALSDKEHEIVVCQRETERAERAIAREQQVGRVSGYVNKMTLREAGEMIVFCQEKIPKAYAEYKRLGGTRPLNELR